MAQDRRRAPPSHPLSVPPEVAEIDSSWDDDAPGDLDLDDPMSESAFDRVTAIPELPSELYAKQVMANENEEPAPASQLGALPSEPPLVSVQPLDPMAFGPRPAAPPHSAGSPLVSSQTAVTARPASRFSLPLEPTGLELQDLTQAGASAAREQGPHSSGSRDPRDPVLELDLGEVARSGPPPRVLMPSDPASPREGEVSEMKDRYAMGDFTGALVVAEGLLEANPDDLDAQRYAQSCRDVLTQMYSARLGSLGQRVSVAVPGDQIRWLSLDHRAGFVLSLIDGSSTVEELLDISGMNRLDALRILYTLFDQRVITLSER